MARSGMLAVAAMTATVLVAQSAQAVKVKAVLAPTAAAPAGTGKATVAAKASKGKFVVVGKHLTPNATFQVVVAGVPIGTFTSGRSGNGRARFSTHPRGTAQPLGVDPRGRHVAVHEMEDGEDELEGDVPDDDLDDARCCLADHDEVECEDRSEAECLAAGGTPKGPGSCLPDPCGDSTTGSLVRCCEDEGDGEAECELRTASACSEHHGISMGAGSCDPNPCAPAGGDAVRCCLPDEDHGGSMHDHGGDDGDEGGDEGELECEHLTHQHCVDAGGTDIGAGSCEGDPCASPSGAFLDPDAGGF